MRLIDADEALRLMSGWDWQDLYLPSHFKELVLDECETVDAEPVRHGKWLGTVCSACGESTSFYYDCDYCPHCGAKMDLK